MAGGPMERLNALETVEKEIISCLQSAGHVLNEMAKDKPSQKQVDVHANHFLKTLNHVEMDLSTHINYLTQVSTGQAHEGSSYASQKTLQMAWHRSSHARSKVAELDRTKSQLISSARQGPTTGIGRGAGALPASSSTTTTTHPSSTSN